MIGLAGMVAQELVDGEYETGHSSSFARDWSFDEFALSFAPCAHARFTSDVRPCTI